MLEAWWPNAQHFRSNAQSWILAGALCCVLGQYILFSKCLSLPRSNAWVIDQVGGQVGWRLTIFFVFMDRDGVEVLKVAKKEQGQYPVILIEQAFSIKDLLYGFFLRDTVSSPERER